VLKNYTIAEASALAGISIRSIRWYVKHGHLASFRFPAGVGRKILIADDVLEAFIAGMRLIG
jgi:DNA-binding transcriptional MerR regulator